jgi:hypothetical protein
VKLATFRKPKAAYFLSYMEYMLNTNISNITYAYKYIKNIYSKMEFVEETKGGGKERKITNN